MLGFETGDSRASFGLESLESRQLLSASHYHLAVQSLNAAHERGEMLNVILFGQAPSAVQTGLNTDATDHGLSALTSATKIRLGNVNGVEIYSARVTDTGAVTTLTVDQLGDPVTAPSASKTTFGDLGTSNSAAADGITKIASALSLTAPATDTHVREITIDGKTLYSVRLTHASSTSTHQRAVTVTVNADGNAAGNEDVPFSVLSTTIQDGLNALAPTGATKLAADSTQTVEVRRIDGIQLYSTTFTTSGATTKVTVDSTGASANLPSSSTTTFGALTQTVQTAIQTLATANGVATPIASDQSIDVYTEANGTILYSATLSATSKKNASITFDLTITVDSNGDPTVLPRRDLFAGRYRGFRGFGGRGFGEFGAFGRFSGATGGSAGGSGDCGSSSGSGSSSNQGSSGSTTNTTSTLRFFSRGF